MTQAHRPSPEVLALARAGDIQGAIRAGEAVLASGSTDGGLALFVGMLCGREGQLERGLPYLRLAVGLAPQEVSAKIELARALIATGTNDEAEVLVAPLASLASAAGREMQRIYAHILLRRGSPDARMLFEQLLTFDDRDFESWDGLGAAQLTDGDIDAAIASGQHATTLRPTAIGYWINLSRAHAAASDYLASANAAREAVALAPGDAAAQLELGRSLAGSRDYEQALNCLAAARAAAPGNAEILSEMGHTELTCRAYERSEASYREALAIKPDLQQAWMGLGKLLERTNRTPELLALLDEAEAIGVSASDTALLRARALRADGRLVEALAAALASPADVDQVSRAQLIGDIADRLDDTDTAFAAFAEANAILAGMASGSRDAAEAYLQNFAHIRAVTTAEDYARWPSITFAGERPAPLFIFGFPRSGTTLIDTMLSGHPDTIVFEEEPIIDRVANALGSIERLATLSTAEVDSLRARYFAEVDRLAPDAAGKLIVDKNPLGLGSTALLHRMFPDARFIFAERHPCDVVLSCFITSSHMSIKVAGFYDFASTARLYDQVLSYWQQCRAVMPIDVHTIRYETLIANPETELRRLAQFACLSWDPRLLANQRNASDRGYIGSPSYAQVAEPIYTRARGRWLRYRDHMAAVIPILEPWVVKLGYSL